MHWLITLGILAALFLALPWLAIVFNRYCDAVNRLVRRRAKGCGPECAEMHTERGRCEIARNR